MVQTQRTTSSEARAQVLLANAPNWSRGTSITATGETVGVVLFTSGSRPGVVYLTRCDGAACNCPAYQRGLRECCHMRAVRLEAEAAREAATPKRVSYDELMDRHLVDAF